VAARLDSTVRGALSDMARFLFFLSVSATVFFLAGFFYEAVSHVDLASLFGAAFALFAGAVVSLTIFKLVPDFLRTDDDSWGPFWFSVRWTILTYFASIPVAAGLGYLYIWVAGREMPKMVGDADLVILIFAWWMPLWWAIAIGLSIGWYRHRIKYGTPGKRPSNKRLQGDAATPRA